MDFSTRRRGRWRIIDSHLLHAQAAAGMLCLAIDYLFQGFGLGFGLRRKAGTARQIDISSNPAFQTRKLIFPGLLVFVVAWILLSYAPTAYSADNCPMLASSDQTDTDGDGVGAACDNCLLDSNAGQLDTDADGYGNLCDGDLDNDGVVSTTDLVIFRNVLFTSDSADADFDGDGFVSTPDLVRFRQMLFDVPGPTGMLPELSNARPTANAGSDWIVPAGKVVQPDGSRSTDPDGDPLDYWWSLVSAPAGSMAALMNPLTANPILQVDVPGSYVVQLVVIDGTAMSVPDTVTIRTLGPGDKIGFIGDSMMVATHADQMCKNRSIIRCIEARLGKHDLAWSHGTGSASWSVANVLGYAPENVVNVAGDGDQWKDALAQAQQTMAVPDVDTVIVNLGANDVCQRTGHDYTGDLEAIGQHVDNVLTYLTNNLPPGGFVGIISVPDILAMRQLMVNRDHNHMFRSCQATWDLDKNRVKDGAAKDACIDLFGRLACDLLERAEGAIDFLVEQFLDYYAREYGVREGVCGKVLSSDSTAQDRAEGVQFNLDLNGLLESKADQYNGRNGVYVGFNWNVYDQASTLRPYHVSRLDCFHPSRAGQMWLAMLIREGWEPTYVPTAHVSYDGFDSRDYCLQEFTTWPSCWLDIQDGDPLSGDVRITGRKLMVRDNNTVVSRQFDLSGQNAAWLQIMYRRDDVSNNQNVWGQLSWNGGTTWTTIADYDDGDDKGDHRGYYYDLSLFPFGPNMWLRFKSSGNLGNNEKVLFDNVKIFSW